MITQSELKKILHYDPEIGIFTWIARISIRISIGNAAGTVDSLGYRQIGINGKKYRAHRLAWFYVYGVWPKCIDHINHIKSDDRIVNLRNVSSAENNRNLKKPKTNISGITGVGWHIGAKNWRAYIRENLKATHLGLFVDKFEAICARKSAETRLGFHPNHGR